MVKIEADYARRQLAKVKAAPEERGFLVSLSAMNYVEGHVRAAVFGHDNDIDHIPAAVTPEAILKAQAGICGAAALTFAAIVKRFGFEVRSVQFYYPDGVGHIGNEVLYAGAWHYFDPTWGVFYRSGGKVLSITSARRLQHPEQAAVVDRTSFWYDVSRRFAPGKVNADVGWLGSIRRDARVVIGKQAFS